MGFMDKAKEQAAQAKADRETAQAEQAAAQAAAQVAASAVTSRCPGGHMVTEVNKGSINMSNWQRHLNDMYGRGYRLAHVFEQDGNTVQVYEHHFH